MPYITPPENGTACFPFVLLGLYFNQTPLDEDGTMQHARKQ